MNFKMIVTLTGGSQQPQPQPAPSPEQPDTTSRQPLDTV